MCGSRSAFVEYRAEHGGRTVSVAKSGATLRVLGTGTVVLRMKIGARVLNARLEKTLHVEDLSRNLFSIPAILAKSMRVSMDRHGCKIVRNHSVVGCGTKIGNLIYLDVYGGADCHAAIEPVVLPLTHSVETSRPTVDGSSDLAHRKPSHDSFGSIKRSTMDVLEPNALPIMEVSRAISKKCDVSAESRSSALQGIPEVLQGGVARYEDVNKIEPQGEPTFDELKDEIDGLHCYSTVLDEDEFSMYTDTFRSKMEQQLEQAVVVITDNDNGCLANMPTVERLTKGSTWTVDIERDAYGDVNKFKALHDKQKVTQKSGVEVETFAPNFKQSAGRVVSASCALLDVEENRHRKLCYKDDKYTTAITFVNDMIIKSQNKDSVCKVTKEIKKKTSIKKQSSVLIKGEHG